MLSERQVEEFHRDGFVTGERVVDDADIERLRADLALVIDGQVPAGRQPPVRCVNLNGDEQRPVWQIVNMWHASAGFEKLFRNDTVVADIAQLTGAAQLRIWHDQIQYKPSEIGGTTDWHQDGPAWRILAPDVQVTAWVALDDVDQDNGCLWMVPRSHTWGEAPAGSLNGELPATYDGHEVAPVPRPVGCGQVHYHHCLTWHASLPNRSERPRRAIGYHYMPESTHYVAAGDHIMKAYVDADLADGQMLAGAAFPRVY